MIQSWLLKQNKELKDPNTLQYWGKQQSWGIVFCGFVDMLVTQIIGPLPKVERASSCCIKDLASPVVRSSCQWVLITRPNPSTLHEHRFLQVENSPRTDVSSIYAPVKRTGIKRSPCITLLYLRTNSITGPLHVMLRVLDSDLISFCVLGESSRLGAKTYSHRGKMFTCLKCELISDGSNLHIDNIDTVHTPTGECLLDREALTPSQVLMKLLIICNTWNR